jgi:hypothetical protein
LLLEGSDIDELLVRIRQEHGPDVRIVHAERKLVGGFAGFFAKRRFEVAVAVDDAAPATTAEPGPATATELAQTPPATDERTAADVPESIPANRIPVQQRQTAAAFVGRPTVSAMIGDLPSPVEFSFARATEPFGSPHVPSPLDELLADADAQDGGLRVPGRQLSTESDSFDDLVRDLIARAAPESRLDAVPDFAPAVPRVLDRSAVPALVDALTAREPEVESELEPEADRQAERETQADLEADVEAEAEVRPSASKAPLVTPAVARLGVPVDLYDVEADRVSLLSVLDDIAVAGPRRLVGVQVLVGDGAAVRELARAWARTTGADDSCLVDLESWQGPHRDDPRDRRSELQRLAREHGGVLVVLPVDDSPSDATQAARQVAELGACTVTATVDARWTSSQVGQWLSSLSALGQPVGRLAAYEVHATADPLSLLEHGLPVTWLDARPATTGAWASSCLDRLR